MDVAKVTKKKWEFTKPCCWASNVEEKSQQGLQEMSGTSDYSRKVKDRKKTSFTWAFPEEDHSLFYRHGCCWPCPLSSGTSLEGKIPTTASNPEDKDQPLTLSPPYQSSSLPTLHMQSVQHRPVIKPGPSPRRH